MKKKFVIKQTQFSLPQFSGWNEINKYNFDIHLFPSSNVFSLQFFMPC
jgi:hypothetical protein